MHTARYRALFAFGLILCPGLRAQSSGRAEAAAPGVAAHGSDSAEPNWVRSWLHRVDQARASQPHFVAPIVTTHVILVQQYRYDMSWQQDTPGGTTANYGAARGSRSFQQPALKLESPHRTILCINSTRRTASETWRGRLSFAPSLQRRAKATTSLASSWEEPPRLAVCPMARPRHMVTHLWGVQGPWSLGHPKYPGRSLPGQWNQHPGKNGHLQHGDGLPDQGSGVAMLEQNSTFWHGGVHDGEKQVFLTPGIVFGSLPVVGRLHFAVGGGVQTAVTHYHQYNHRWILSMRFPF